MRKRKLNKVKMKMRALFVFCLPGLLAYKANAEGPAKLRHVAVGAIATLEPTGVQQLALLDTSSTAVLKRSGSSTAVLKRGGTKIEPMTVMFIIGLCVAAAALINKPYQQYLALEFGKFVQFLSTEIKENIKVFMRQYCVRRVHGNEVGACRSKRAIGPGTMVDGYVWRGQPVNNK